MNSNEKQRLILISDLWGSKNSEWISSYTSILNQHFDVFFYSSTELAEINIFNLAQEKIHQKFIEAGIEKAVENPLVLALQLRGKLLCEDCKYRICLQFLRRGFVMKPRNLALKWNYFLEKMTASFLIQNGLRI